MIDSFQGKRDPRKQRDLFNSFRYLHFQGPVDMLNPELEMCVFEDFERESPEPHEIHFGRFIASSGRHAVAKHDLKKRRYISKTSMEAELSLVAANISLAAPNKLFYDPFVGTGSFAVTCAHFGTMFLGSDIDGRSIRGTQDRNLLANFTQYDLRDLYLDSFIADVVHCPLRNLQIFDGIICDPPYGVREGPRVLGLREGKKARNVSINGVPAHQREGYIPPKKPYSFEDMVQDLFELAFAILKDHGTLSMWLPMANEEEATAVLPHHSGFDLSSCCVQRFNKWSRRLATYRRKRNTASRASVPSNRPFALGNTANDLNRFRKRVSACRALIGTFIADSCLKYFQGFANSVVC